jgi:methanogenic corrinoid protein MtbC1
MSTSENLARHRDAYLSALLARDSAAARRAVEAASSALPVADVYLDVLQPALYEIGHKWALGEINVAHEHYATAITAMLRATLRERMRIPPRDGRLAIVAGSPGEQHALGAQIVADFLESDGWEVLPLGASTPAPDLAELADQERPDVVGVSTSTAGSLPGIADVVERLGALRPRPLIVLGGQFWTDRATAHGLKLGADLVERDPRRAVAELRRRVPPRA